MSEPSTVMRLAHPCKCKAGHMYYREALTDTGCPYCLRLQLTQLRTQLRRISEFNSFIAHECKE